VSDYIELGPVDDMQPGTMKVLDTEKHDFLIARVGDEYYITDAHCPHLGGPLGKGVLEGTVLTCPWHHSQFDLKDGSCLRWTDWKGAVLSVAELARHPRPVRAYESKVEGGVIFVGHQKPPGSVPE
jgi:3-phenylpropionate/trans-cinnamate dioxygenase ferredoxin subunit